MLHLISKISFDLAILQRMGRGDVVVFLDNAVLSIAGMITLEHVMLDVKCYVLLTHLQVYGIAKADLPKEVEVVDYDCLVNLTVNNTVIQTWS